MTLDMIRCRDAVRHMSVHAGIHPPHGTDSHGQRPLGTLTCRNSESRPCDSSQARAPTVADEFQWARVESWEDAGHAVVCAIGREVASGVRPGPLATIEMGQIADWGVWVDGMGVTDGVGTEGVDHHLS